MGQPVVHFEIMGKDAVRLQKFYSELFQWQIGPAMPEMGFYGMVDGASSGLPGGIGQDAGGTARVTLYVQVADLEAKLAQVVAMGGTVLMAPTSIPGGPTIAIFADPDGNKTGLLKG